MIRTLTIVYSSATGHTEFVVDAVENALKGNADLRIVRRKSETTQPEDLTKADVLLLACGSWNTGGAEGQLSPYMHDLLTGRAKDADLKGKPAAAIGLGDERYYFTARAADKLTEYLQTHGAALLLPTLKIVNDPFDQTKKVSAWVKELATKIHALPATVASPKKK